MKAFIDRIFKARKQKELVNESVTTEVKEQATEAVIEAIKPEVKKQKHIDCECKDCIKRIKQNAK
jgi:hypothetical protein